MSADHIICHICNAKVHSVELHLKKEHAEGSRSPCTLEGYKDKYPDAELLSGLAKAKIEEHRARMAPRTAAAPAKAEKPAGSKGEMHKLFRLGTGNNAAMRSDGSPIMVSVSQQDGFEELVPDYNGGFVYNVDILKSVLMAFELKKPCFLFGDPGVGKSQLLKQVCAATSRRYLRFQHMAETQYSHVIGQWTVKTQVDEAGNAVSYTHWQWGPLPMAMMNGWVFNADEIDRAPPSLNSVYQAILEGEPLFVPEAPEDQRVIKPHAEFFFCATGNTNGSGDQTGLFQSTMQQDAATIERFSVVLGIPYLESAEEEAILKAVTPISDEDAKALVKFANAIRKRFPEDFDLTMGPRVLINIAETGMARGSMMKGIELSFANRLPADQRKSALDAASRSFD